MESIKSLWGRLTRPSHHRDLTHEEVERWTLRNATFLVVPLFCVVSLVALYFLGVNLLNVWLATTVLAIACSIAYGLSRRGHRRAAGVCAILGINLCILYGTYNYGAGLFESGYCMSVCIAFLVFEREDRVVLYGSLTITIVLVAMALVPGGIGPRFELSEGERATLRGVVLVLACTNAATVLRYFVISRHRIIKRLHEALAASQAASETRSRFLANISHEIRTPMNGVLGMLSILEDTSLSEGQRSYIHTARTSGNALLHIIDDILDLARVESGSLALRSSPFHLRALVEDTAQQASVEARDKDLEVIVHYAPDVPAQVIGDATRVRQVLSNLVSNAVKFTQRGHILITLRCPERAGRAGQRGEVAQFELAVADTGMGIAREAQALIFEKFKQGDASPTRKQGGAGLGLALVKQLVTYMGGTVELESEAGKGATFFVRVPLELDADSPPLPLDRGELAGVRALIVDDHPVARHALEEQLDAWGMVTRTCASGEEAMRELREARAQGERLDMVLVDREMPELDGVALALGLEDELGSGRPLIVMLARAHEALRTEQIARIGCAGQVQKPVREADLHEVLCEVWRKRHERTLPSRRESAPLSELRRARAISSELARKARVLVVEDNTVNQKVATRMLSRLGCQTDVAHNGREALVLVHQVPYDLVFMDIQMPEMDGLTATVAIREREASSGAHLPIVAMTAHTLAEDRERCLAAGMDGYLSKPIRPGDVAAVLVRFLGDIEPGPAPSL